MTAARQGFEPQLTDSESAVLPLDDRAVFIIYTILYTFLKAHNHYTVLLFLYLYSRIKKTTKNNYIL